MSTTIEKTVLNKSARLDLKTNQQLKAQLEDAAAFSGVSLTAFILSAASDKAREVMEFHSNTVLSLNAWNNLNKAIDNPPTEVTAGMRALFKEDPLKNGEAY
ncbi:MAG: DUF1778 domain-containing protein [Pseudomonadota bacterium]|nr:DUF1778 domain-containing protein [Pseudomonadota bacterium]